MKASEDPNPVTADAGSAFDDGLGMRATAPGRWTKAAPRVTDGRAPSPSARQNRAPATDERDIRAPATSAMTAAAATGAPLVEHPPDTGLESRDARSVEIDLGMDGFTELRIHGVSGTPPEQVLDHPLLRRVAGDIRAGFYRRRYPGGRSNDLRSAGRLEAYSWGGLTSGSVARAAWVLLLPFMLVNLAYWMLPPVPDTAGRLRRAAAAGSALLLRMIALSLTITIVLATANLSMDMGAWQCAADPRCAAQSGFPTILYEGVMAPATRRLALGALLGCLVLILLSLPGRGSLQRSASAPDDAAPTQHDEPMRSASFWRGNPGLAQLRAAHLAAGTSVLAVALAWPVSRLAADAADRALGVTLAGAAAALIGLSVLLAAAGPVSGREADPDASSWSGRAVRRGASGLVARLSAAVMLAVLGYAAWPRRLVEPMPDALAGLQPMVLGLFAVQGAALACLVVTVAAQRPWAADTGPMGITARGFAAPAVCTFAWLAAGGVTAGVTFRAAELLGHPVLSYDDARAESLATRRIIEDATAPLPDRLAAVAADQPIVVPPAYSWAGLAAFVLTVALVLGLLYAVLVVRARTAAWLSAVTADYPDPPAGSAGTLARISRTWALASLTEHAGRALARMAQVSGLVIAGLAVLYVLDAGRWQLVTSTGLAVPTRLGTWLIGLLGLGTVLVLSQTARNATARRMVGIAWDVGTFWPRTAHPMAPPCYAERAVPDLVERITALTRHRDDRVVLSGHSQGSVLAAAALLQVTPSTADRVRLLTHGSPLRRLYARFFPAYLGPSTLDLIRDTAGPGRWVNLYRSTDPIGSWVLSDGPGDVDRRLLDPRTLDSDLQGHASYWFDPAYTQARSDVLAQ